MPVKESPWLEPKDAAQDGQSATYLPLHREGEVVPQEAMGVPLFQASPAGSVHPAESVIPELPGYPMAYSMADAQLQENSSSNSYYNERAYTPPVQSPLFSGPWMAASWQQLQDIGVTKKRLMISLILGGNILFSGLCLIFGLFPLLLVGACLGCWGGVLGREHDPICRILAACSGILALIDVVLGLAGTAFVLVSLVMGIVGSLLSTSFLWPAIWYGLKLVVNYIWGMETTTTSSS